MFDALRMNERGIVEALKVEKEVPPWMVPAFVEWIEPRLTKEMTVWEFGSGNSTLWFARRVKQISTVEHHKLWADALRPIRSKNTAHWFIPANVEDHYPFIHPSTLSPDILIVDGMQRDACIQNALPQLKPNTLIILDNSESEAIASQELLHQQGWNRLDFEDVYPWDKAKRWVTTVFSRQSISETS